MPLSPPEPEVVFLSAVDPLNLVGILTPAPRVTANASNIVTFHGSKVAGNSKGGELWVEEYLPGDVSRTIARTLETGKIL